MSDPFENKMHEGILGGKSTPEEIGSDFDDKEVIKIISFLETGYPEIAEALKSLSNSERKTLDQDLSFQSEGWGLFRLIDENNQDKIIPLISSFKEANADYVNLFELKSKEEARVRRQNFIKELVRVLS